MVNEIRKGIRNLEIEIIEFDEDVFQKNIEMMLDFETCFHKIPSSDFKRVAKIWGAMTEYYIEYLLAINEDYKKEGKRIVNIYLFGKQEVANHCLSIYDHTIKRKKEGGEEYGGTNKPKV